MRIGWKRGIVFGWLVGWFRSGRLVYEPVKSKFVRGHTASTSLLGERSSIIALSMQEQFGYMIYGVSAKPTDSSLIHLGKENVADNY